MELKKRKETTFYNLAGKRLKNFFKFLFNRKTKIFFGVLFFLTIFLIGTFSGLLISGFFGTFDNPSQKAIDLMHMMGIYNLKSLKAKLDGVRNENIMIPCNYVKGQFSNPEKIFIDIGFKDYQKIEFKRQRALEQKRLITEPGDYVPAKINYKGKEVDVELRLKGDMTDHFEGNKWSFRIKVKGTDTLFGMRIFSIQDPKTRTYLNEWFYQNALKEEDILSVRYEFIEVVVNGKNKGIYALEEHFDKKLIEYNNRREGVIIKFGTDFLDETDKIKKTIGDGPQWWSFKQERFLTNWFQGTNVEIFRDKDLDDPALAKQFEEARHLINSFKTGKLKTHEVFDIEKLATYFAINTLTGSSHASDWDNLRFYYNPITSKLEPIGFDSASGIALSAYSTIDRYMPDYYLQYNGDLEAGTLNYYDLFFTDKIFFEKYMQELKRVSKKSYLDELFFKLEESLEENLNIIHKDNPFYHFSPEKFYLYQKQITQKFNQSENLNIYLQESLPIQNRIILSIGNVDSFPFEVINLVYNNSINFELAQQDKIIQPITSSGLLNYKEFKFKVPARFISSDDFVSNLKLNYKIIGIEEILQEEVIPWSYLKEDFLQKDFIRQEPITNSTEFLTINNNTNSIFIKKGMWTLNHSLIFPAGFSVFAEEGTIVNLINKATILSYSDIQFRGTEENPIQIISTDGTGQGLVVLDSLSESNFEHVYFKNLTNPSKNYWELTSALTFYESPVKFNYVLFSGMVAEDSLNIIRSEFEIKNSVFEDCFSDCLDIDFGNGLIENVFLDKCGNDCLDFSGSDVELDSVTLTNAEDKGLSCGEKSYVFAKNIKINNCYVGVAGKDLSNLNLDTIEISNCEYGFATYKKKSEFGSASINSINANLSNNKNDYLIEYQSNFSINQKIILGTKNKVYEKLYPIEY